MTVSLVVDLGFGVGWIDLFRLSNSPMAACTSGGRASLGEGWMFGADPGMGLWDVDLITVVGFLVPTAEVQ
jgi:hypothetical protein